MVLISLLYTLDECGFWVHPIRGLWFLGRSQFAFLISGLSCLASEKKLVEWEGKCFKYSSILALIDVRV